MDDRERLMRLNLVSDVGSLRTKRLLDAFGSLRAVYAAPAESLQQVDGIGPKLARRIAAELRDHQPLLEETQLAKQAGCAMVTLLDEGYPDPLKTIPDPPLVLYMKGQWTGMDRTAVAMVGSRSASLYGRRLAERLAYDLAIRGITVVSGLARGIDAAAHRGALKAGGRTLAVVGNGLESIYPPEHDELAEQITKQGAVLSEYPMRMKPLGQNFPRRNRLISGLCLGVIVVEAARRSGALITVDCALEQGREVFAVPGMADSRTSQGTHQLLKQGARLVTSVEDILEELRLTPCESPAAAAGEGSGAVVAEAVVTDDEQQLLGCLSGAEPQDLDALAAATGFPAATCATALLRLELKRLVTQLPGKRFLKSGSVAG